jgi:hypothetical protein
MSITGVLAPAQNPVYAGGMSIERLPPAVGCRGRVMAAQSYAEVGRVTIHTSSEGSTRCR